MKIFAGVAVSLCLALTFSVTAQEKEQPESYIYATYFYCDTSNEESADEGVKNVLAPAYDAALAAGEITSWGWLAHNTGGQWRRILYHSAGSAAAVLDAGTSIADRVGDTDPGIGVSCKSHDDYIWKGENGQFGTERGPAGLSVYFVCSINKEERADELVASLFAPLYNQKVSEGKLASWGWASHILGGKYRRLLTTTAADFKSALAARDSILEALEDAEGADEFSEICGSHSDYLWDVQLEKP